MFPLKICGLKNNMDKSGEINLRLHSVDSFDFMVSPFRRFLPIS